MCVPQHTCSQRIPCTIQFFPSIGSRGLNSGQQAWWQVHLTAKPLAGPYRLESLLLIHISFALKICFIVQCVHGCVCICTSSTCMCEYVLRVGNT